MFEHYLHVRELFALSLTDSSLKSELRSLFSHPFAQRFPLTQALSCWNARVLGEVHPPLLLEGHKALPLSQQCELALIWAAMKEPAACALAARLAPLVEHELTTLWASDKEYEAPVVFALFSRALGRDTQKPNIELSPFFTWIESLQLSIEPSESFEPPYTLFSERDAACALIHTGSRTSLGAMRVGPLRIPAFGFQAPPFSDVQLFGSDAVSPRWHRISNTKEIWARVEPKELGFSVQTLGLSLKNPLYLSFYVTASECRVGAQIIKPKSLTRFRGPIESIRLTEQGRSVTLGCGTSLNAEIIPLAGEREFWGATFLVAFQLPTSSDKLTWNLN